MPNKKKDLCYALMFLLTALITLLKPELIIVTIINFVFSICYFYIYYVDCDIERGIKQAISNKTKEVNGYYYFVDNKNQEES